MSREVPNKVINGRTKETKALFTRTVFYTVFASGTFDLFDGQGNVFTPVCRHQSFYPLGGGRGLPLGPGDVCIWVHGGVCLWI